MPILRSATSRAILANLAGRKRAKLLKQIGPHGAETLKKLTDELEKVRKLGICMSRGEMDPGLVGFAASVSNRSLGIDASLTFIFDDNDFSEEHAPRVYSLLSSNARLIENYMEDAFQDLVRRSSDQSDG